MWPEDIELVSPVVTCEGLLADVKGIFHFDFALSGLIGWGERAADDERGGDWSVARELFPAADSGGKVGSSTISSMDCDMLLPGLLSTTLLFAGREATPGRQGSVDDDGRKGLPVAVGVIV